MTPSSLRADTTFHMSCRSSTSTPAVGSSRKRTSGSCASALAIRTLRFIPPDNSILIVSFLSHNDRDFSTFSMCSGLAGLPNKPRLNRQVFQMVSNDSDGNSCGTSPIIPRVRLNSVAVSCPSTRISPAVAFTIPQTALINVVLPAPFGPSSAKISPR